MTTIVSGDTVTLRMDLHDTGTLCHLMMQSFLQAGIDPSKPIRPQIREQPEGSLLTRDTITAGVERSVRLYGRLATANNKLMRGAIT